MVRAVRVNGIEMGMWRERARRKARMKKWCVTKERCVR